MLKINATTVPTGKTFHSPCLKSSLPFQCRYLQSFAASSSAAKTRGIGGRESEKEANILWRQRRRPYKTRKPKVYLSKATRHRHTYVRANDSMGARSGSAPHTSPLCLKNLPKRWSYMLYDEFGLVKLSIKALCHLMVLVRWNLQQKRYVAQSTILTDLISRVVPIFSIHNICVELLWSLPIYLARFKWVLLC